MTRCAFGVDDKTCSTLEEVWIDHKKPDWIHMLENAFAYRIINNCKLYVPEGCKEIYAEKWPWYNFGSILNGDAQSVDISESTLALGMRQSAQLFATVSPEKVFDPTLTWASSNTAVATVDDNGEVTAVGPGEATITATTRNGKSASCTVTVTKMEQEITWEQTFDDVVKGETITLTATASSGLEVTYEIQSGQEFASLSGNKLTILSLGKIVIVASQDGDDTYKAAEPVTKECIVTATKKKQEITWEQTFNDVVEGETITLTATASSGLEVTYEIQSGEEFASLSGNKLTILSPGKIVVVASQDGDDNYEAAEPVTKEITAAAGIATISADDNSAAEYFTLQGLKVTTLTPGTLVIRLSAGKADKVLVK